MFRIALKNVLARKGRLLLSSLAVIAGCAFLSGVFVFSDTIRDSIDRVFATAYEKTDAYVRSSLEIETDFGDPIRGRISDELIAEIEKVQGVAEVEGDVQSFARITTAEGETLGFDGPPKFGSVFTDSEMSPWDLDEGRPPSGSTEVVIDKQSAKNGDVEIGDTVTVTATGQPRDFTVVGIVTFAGNDSTGGPTWALFDLPTAQDFVIGEPGQLDSILVRGDGSRTQEQLQTDIQALFDKDQTEVLTGAEIIEESQNDLADQFGFFTTFLTVFAGISLLVGAFIIYNVFKISSAQRMRENALMRAIGARSSQVTSALFVEALVVGVLGGLLGFAGGIGLVFLITVLLNAVGFGFGDTNVIIGANSFVITLAVGVIVTMVCAILPALRAGRVPPLAAMRDVSIDRSGVSRRRIIVGSVFAAIAIGGVALGLAGDAIWLAPGVLGMFVTLIAFGPIVVGPVARLLTRPLAKIRGVTGEVAGRNASRSPERTALTAAALGIGLSLLVAISTLGSSVQESIRQTIGEAFVGDIAISPSDQGVGGVPVELADELNQVDDVQIAVGFGAGAFRRFTEGDEHKDGIATLTNPDQAAQLLKLDFVAGDWSSVGGDKIAVDSDTAEDNDWSVGDSFRIQLRDFSFSSLTIGAIYEDGFFGQYIADRAFFGKNGEPQDFQIVALTAPGVSIEQARASIQAVTENYPTAKVQTRGEYIDSFVSQINGLLNFIYALLAMSIFIASLGIVITLLLAVYERRRELGLMRAIGTTRPQIRGSIRWEAILTALLGAIMGTALGLALGWIVVTALKDEGINTFAVAPTSIVIFAILAVLLAVLAAWIPARKAAKAGILEAIATT